MAADALQRACDTIPDPTKLFDRSHYFQEQTARAIGWIIEARNHAGFLKSEFVFDDEPAAASGEPSTADLVPYRPVEGTTEGGGA